MSLFSVAQYNNLKIRSQEIYGEKFFVKDPATSNWIPLKPGGEGPVTELPYYLNSTDIEMDDGLGHGVVIDPTGVTFGDSTGNKKINGDFVRNVETLEDTVEQIDTELTTVQLDTLTLKNTTVPALTTRVTAVEGVNTTQGTDITALKTNTANIKQLGTTSLTLGYNTTSTNRAQLNASGLTVYLGSPSVIPTGSVPRVTIKPDSIDFTTSTGGGVYLDVGRIDTLAKLTSVTTSDFNDKLNLTKGVTFPGAVESTDTSNKKMVVMDATTKALSYATIPSGGSAVPTYLKDNHILMTTPTHSLYLSPSVIEFGRIVGGNNELIQLDIDSFANLVPDPAIKNIPKQTKWVAPNYTTMGGTAPTVVTNNEVHNFDKPLYFFNEMHKPGDTLWVDLSTWNAPVGTTNETSRGIFLSFKAFEWSENQTYEITFSQTNVTVTNQEVHVFNTTTAGRRALFVWFKSNSGTVPVTGWLKIKLGNTFKTPVYPDIATAYPSSAVQP